MKFLDAAYSGSASAFISAAQHEQAQGFAWYCGGNYVLNIWGLRRWSARRQVAKLVAVGVHPTRADLIRSWLEQPARAVSGLVGQLEGAGYQAMAIYVSTIAGRSGAADGLDAANIVSARGAPPGYKIVWDLEAGIYQGNPGGAAIYGGAWCEAVRSRGFSPVVYSTPAGCRACGTHADFVWAAVPGHSDPATVFGDSFMAGHIAVQYGGGSWAGVSYDVNISQFAFTAQPVSVPTLKEVVMLIRDVVSGAVWLVGVGGRRHLPPTEAAAWKNIGTPQLEWAPADVASIPLAGSKPYPRDATSGAIYDIGDEGKTHITGPWWAWLNSMGLAASVDVDPALLAGIPDAP